MREHGWLHKNRRKQKGLTHATTEIQERENLLKYYFSMSQPFKKILTDISQMQCSDEKLYISPILDCFNGEIPSLIMIYNMKKELCIDTLHAVTRRYKLEGTILYSDRGSQYTNDAFHQELSKEGVTQSVSRVECCCDKAKMEIFLLL